MCLPESLIVFFSLSPLPLFVPPLQEKRVLHFTRGSAVFTSDFWDQASSLSFGDLTSVKRGTTEWNLVK